MKKFNLIRLSEAGPTFGVLLDEKLPFAVTLERQWMMNERGVSCIPAREYICKRVKSPRFGDTFEVTNVPERSEILFHKGNLVDDTHGCIVLGEQFGQLDGKNAILSSGPAFTEFMERLKDEVSFYLEIWPIIV